LPLEEKRVARLGLAVVNQETCLPHAGREDCQLCVDECVTAGYNAIEFIRVGRDQELPDDLDGGSGFLAPAVLSDKCVGCGLCQTRCYAINVKAKGLITTSAVVVEAGQGNEDRLLQGSYVALREEEKRQREEQQTKLLEQSGSDGGYLPDFLR
jgi:ferredoxin